MLRVLKEIEGENHVGENEREHFVQDRRTQIVTP